VYRYEAANGQLIPLGQADQEPQGFINGKMHLARKVKLERERPFWGHYLLPLGQDAKPDSFIMLEQVEVKQ
jgi:hypothetical protein